MARSVILVAMGEWSIVREGRRHWLRHVDGTGASLEHIRGVRQASIGTGAGLAVYGGLLPPGCASATGVPSRSEEVEAVVQNGAWLCVAGGQQDGLPVRFSDSEGRTIRARPRRRRRRRPINDATDPCPACGRYEWEFSARPRSLRDRFGVIRSTSLVIDCKVCGYETSGGVLGLHLRQRPDPAQIEADSKRLQVEALDAIDFPLFFAAGDHPAPALAAYGGDGTRVHRATLRQTRDAQDWIAVETDRCPDPFPLVEHLRRQFVQGLSVPPPPEVSPPARHLWIQARQRERQALVATAPQALRELRVDGVPMAFAAIELPGLWAAAADLAQARVTITARGVRSTSVALRSQH